ncbi:putative prenylcysteine oxidase 1 precursor protein [Rosellinia necatrix]|uniref:Putative prenylcysteine oxidase 1 protein n=1 Tax=Rosellinia necatrix TaxID=77044 RepID=A0A1W2TGY2_ROSNE|nr:putative prenylcysteine oxidase 1 precursor protein [Rosellinia necatrix]
MAPSQYRYTSGQDNWNPGAGSAGYAAMPPPYSRLPPSASERAPLLAKSGAEGVHFPVRGRTARLVILTTAFLAMIWCPVYFWRFIAVPPDSVPTYSVAIIGAGPAGVAAAQHIRTSPAARYVRFNITLYESKHIVGGALALHHTNESSIFPKEDPMQDPITAEDIAGTSLMWDNALFTRDSEKVLKDEVGFIDMGPEQIGYYKNTMKTASTTHPYEKMPMMTWLQLLWTYGSSVWQGNKLAQDGNLRKAMLKVPLVPDVEGIFNSLGVLKAVKQKARDMLRDRQISDRYAIDILEPQVQRACGQRLDQVTGLTAMMAASRQESANVYQGGNLIERLQRIAHKVSADIRTSRRVTGIKHVEIADDRFVWLVRHESAGGGIGNSSVEVFDKVIVAALNIGIQLETGNQRILDLTKHYNIRPMDIRSSPTQVTFFTSQVKLSPWNHDEDQVLFLEAWRAAGMRELALVREIMPNDGDNSGVEYLYRALSRLPVLEELRSHAQITWSYQTTIENAYPLLFPRQHFPSFELPAANGLWWTSVIQQAGSSVDLNWLAGKIVAQDLIREVTKG